MTYMLSFDMVSVAIGFCVAVCLMLAIFLPKLARMKEGQTYMQQVFDQLAQESLRKSQEQFLLMAEEKLKQSQKDSAFDLERRQKAVADLVDPIGKSLKDMENKIETLGKAGAGLEAQLKTFAEDQRFLRDQTQSLVQVLRNPTARGRWGEMQLQRTFELVGFVEGVHYASQKSVLADGSAQKPDFIVTLPNGVQIVIDVKTPLDPYWQMIDEEKTQTEGQALLHFRQKVRDHLKSLSTKEYWRQFDSPEFVVMFLPSESLYSLAVSQDQSLLEEASRSNIILASPTTIMGLLRVVMYGWQQQKIADEARTVANLGTELYRRISVFGDHMSKLGRSLGSAVDGYNKAVGSLDQMVVPVLRKFKDLQVPTGGKEIPDTPLLESTPRLVSAPELQSDLESELPAKLQKGKR
ncbi:MAG: DNA recombination protein RmuC [Alphaproteobacteria bacterium]|nr:DNA recombination protein RmuC [Alphaproteobacteria bacterium]